MIEKYVLEFWDDEDRNLGIEPHWHIVPLEMCRGNLLCERCKKDIKHLDICDYTFMWTTSKQIAIDKKEGLEKEGFKVRMIKVKEQEKNQ